MISSEGSVIQYFAIYFPGSYLGGFQYLEHLPRLQILDKHVFAAGQAHIAA